MAGSAFFALIDDIATVLDDVSLMTKVAAKKTAGVLGDDLALNAQQVAGVRAERELPVVWAVAKGSLKNKAILVPAALAISAFILGGDAAADAGRRLPVLRGLREAGAQVPAA
jgi:predicted DNA repair protein MutK